MFDSDKLKVDKILEAHQKTAIERLGKKLIILAIQDTTYFRFDALVDLRRYEARKRKEDMHGIVMHHCLATTSEGIPLAHSK